MNSYNLTSKLRKTFINNSIFFIVLLGILNITLLLAKKIKILHFQSILNHNNLYILSGLILVFLCNKYYKKKNFIEQIVSNEDRNKVRGYLKQYGDNSISYLALEKDKKYFFSENIEGVVTYVISSGVAVCAGDPICDENDIVELLSEFISYCKEKELRICFCQTSSKFMNEFNKLGFGSIKYGEEAMFDLDIYTTSGKKAAKIRQAINNANRLGVEVLEYKPLENKDINIEKEILEVSNEWLSLKKSGELSFMLGSISLEKPMDRRYFIAVDSDKKILGFVVFVPFLGGKGYYADVTRRRKDAPIGVMEKIIINAFNEMKAEGVKWGSLGVAPLANVREDKQKIQITSFVMEFIYKKINNFYGFKSLHQYKKKYGPTMWESRFLVYYPRIFTPKMAYSIIKVKNPGGVKDFLINQIKRK
ncbi:bifunctional lysylphosphatidylglycerol flippase/synthetase MprF [Tepidibacter sp. Z1-5]|uniref:bifunctional lysylphosphatidylglycerol flippase/synthetase MprF n=1 Tax=Tepidibacter sp. Z1-5 TaxID=3134138 RepID=UPI0030C0601E